MSLGSSSFNTMMSNQETNFDQKCFTGGPHIEITEQPQSKGFRFRYACEGKSHGGIQGASSRKDKKTYPTIKLKGCCGSAKVTVSLVTDEEVPKPHAHELIGKNCENGICTMIVKGDDNIISFPNLGIKHITKKNVVLVLQDRFRELYRWNKMCNNVTPSHFDVNVISLTDEEESMIKRQAEEQSKEMQLSVVRLQFQACLLNDDGNIAYILPSVFSCPIYDSKASCASLLKICRMDKVGGCCTGNDEVFLLCDKIQKDDIAVRFYEQDENGHITWEAFANFAPHDVHRQYAIVFQTPVYSHTNIANPVTVHVQLMRFSDGEVSDPKTFVYHPREMGVNGIHSKRRKQFHFPDGFESSVSDGSSSNIINNNNLNFSVSNFNYPSLPNTGDKSVNHSTLLQEGFPRQHLPLTVSYESMFSSDDTNSSMFLLGRGGCKYNLSEQSEDSKREKNNANIKNAEMDQSQQQTHKVDTKGHKPDYMFKKIDQLSKCLQLYSSTEDVRFLISPLKTLIKNQNDDGDNPIHLSVIHNKSMAAFNLLSVLSSSTTKYLALDQTNDLNQSPVLLSILTNEVTHLKMLLECECDIKQITEEGDTLLHVATKLDRHKCIDMLFKHAHDDLRPIIDQFNYHGFTAVHEASSKGHLNCLKLLVSNGADMQLKDQISGKTALHHAIESNHVYIVSYLLLETTIDVNLTTFNGVTALQMAVVNQQVENVALLVSRNANLTASLEDILSIGEESSDSCDEENPIHYETDPHVNEMQDLLSKCEVSPSLKEKTDQGSKNWGQITRLLKGESYENVCREYMTEMENSINQVILSAHDSGIGSLCKD